jgi:MFS family permease
VFREAYGGIPSVLRQLPRSLKALGVVIILLFMCNGIAGSFWVVYAVELMDLSSVKWGLILLVEAALKTVLYIPGGLLVDHYSRWKMLLASLVISLVSIPMFVLSTGFYQVLLIRVAVAVATALFIPACTALMADSVPREMRGRVMAAFGRGSVMLGATGGGTGGPGMGYFITIPVIIASIAGGVLYTANPTYPWVFVFAATLTSVIVSAAFVRDPKGDEA